MGGMSVAGDVPATLALRFTALDTAEAEAVLADVREVVLQRMECHGFNPEGVIVLTETTGGPDGP